MKMLFIALMILFPAFANADFGVPYSPNTTVLDTLKQKYSNRFYDFTDELKRSVLFALPSKLAVSGLNGTSSVPLNLGRYGSEYNFDYSTVFGDLPLQILRSLCLSLSSFYGLTRLLRGGGG